MDRVCKEIKNGHKIARIYYDHLADSPREWENLGIIAYAHGRYILGDEKIDDAIDWLESKLGIEPAGVYTDERLEELEADFFDKFVALPLYLFDHGGITISTTPFSCPWDSGKVGYIYVDDDRLKSEYGKVTDDVRERALGVLRSEVKVFDDYLRGLVFGFRIVEEDHDWKGDWFEEELDSCWGFYGTDFKNNGIGEYLRAHGFSDDEINY